MGNATLLEILVVEGHEGIEASTETRSHERSPRFFAHSNGQRKGVPPDGFAELLLEFDHALADFERQVGPEHVQLGADEPDPIQAVPGQELDVFHHGVEVSHSGLVSLHDRLDAKIAAIRAAAHDLYGKGLPVQKALAVEAFDSFDDLARVLGPGGGREERPRIEGRAPVPPVHEVRNRLEMSAREHVVESGEEPVGLAHHGQIGSQVVEEAAGIRRKPVPTDQDGGLRELAHHADEAFGLLDGEKQPLLRVARLVGSVVFDEKGIGLAHVHADRARPMLPEKAPDRGLHGMRRGAEEVVELDAKAVSPRDLRNLNEGVREDGHPRIVRCIEQQEITRLTLPIHR